MRCASKRALAAMGFALCTAGWTLDRHAGVRDANELYAAGEYAEAEAAFNEALIDQPDSGRIRFNLGDATYRQSKYEDAAGIFGHVVSTTPQSDPRYARAAYNRGHAQYRLGQAAEAENPQHALDLWGDALVSYRQAMGADPADVDAKFNFEFVQRKIDELHERMEQEQEEQEQQDQEQDEEQQDDQNQDQEEDQNQEQPQDEQDEQEQQEQEQQQPEDEEPQEQERPQDSPGEQAPEEDPEDLSQREAQALLDSLRDEEVDPKEIIERLQGGAVAAPTRDW